MCAEIVDLDVVDDDNTARFPEGMLVKNVNNSARQLEGILARWFKDQNASVAAGGTADVVTMAANQTITAYYDGLLVGFKASGTNTGAMTINVDGLGAKVLKKQVTVDMLAGEIISGQKVIAVYDGTNFQMVSAFKDGDIGASEAAAAASAAAALVSENNAAADAILTAADVVTTNADVVLTNADVVTTGNNVTAAQTAETNAEIAETNAAASAAAADVAKIEWQGTYSGATAYALNDAVTYLGSSFICIQAGTGQTPVVGGTVYWDDLANKGADGSGDLTAANNLSDVASATTSRTNLGLEIGVDVLAPDGDGSQLTGITSGFKNVLINADFRINQRTYVSSAVLASGSYGHDRWKAGSGGGDYSFTQLENSTQITIASGKTLIQVIEANNIVGGNYVLSWSGTAQGRYGVDTSTPSGAYASSPITISSQTAGTVMSIEFDDGTLSDVQLELGSSSTDFEIRPYGVEFDLCQRYFELGGVEGDCVGWAISATGIEVGIKFSTQKRTSPTITLLDATPTIFQGAGTSVGSGSTLSSSSPSIHSSRMQVIGFSGLTVSGALMVFNTTPIFSYDAEL